MESGGQSGFVGGGGGGDFRVSDEKKMFLIEFHSIPFHDLPNAHYMLA